MKIIAEKKVNPWVTGIALYLSFCAANLYFSRGDWAYSLSSLGGPYQTAFLSNIFLAFFVGGIAPFALYELITFFMFKTMKYRLGAVTDDMKYALRFFYFAANCVVALLSLLYLISPIISIYGGVVFPPLCEGVFSALYIAYEFKSNVKKENWGFALLRFCGAFAFAYALVTVLSIVGLI